MVGRTEDRLQRALRDPSTPLRELKKLLLRAGRESHYLPWARERAKAKRLQVAAMWKGRWNWRFPLSTGGVHCRAYWAFAALKRLEFWLEMSCADDTVPGDVTRLVHLRRVDRWVARNPGVSFYPGPDPNTPEQTLAGPCTPYYLP